MHIFVLPNTDKENSIEVASAAIELLLKNKCKVTVLASVASLLLVNNVNIALTEAEGFSNCDIVLTIGGDGTILHTAQKMIYKTKPLIGINTGRLGFLTAIEPNELEKLEYLCSGDYIIENRNIIEADNSIEFLKPCYALNDVVLFKDIAESMVSFDIYCDDVLVSSFRGDGAVFSTPTGSTAYSMSAGGPIVDASINAIIFTQICAHIVHMPPMVFAGNRLIKVVPLMGFGANVTVSCDGVKALSLDTSKPIFIKQSTLQIPFIQIEGASQLKSIDKKLKVR